MLPVISNFLRHTNISTLAGTGAVLGASGGLFYTFFNYIKSGFNYIKSGLLRLLIKEYNITATRGNDVFGWFESYFHNHEKIKNSNRQILTTKYISPDHDDDYDFSVSRRISGTSNSHFKLTPGTDALHFFWYHRKLFWFVKSETKLNNGILYGYTLKTFNTGKKKIDDLFHEIYSKYGIQQKEDTIQVYFPERDYWEKSSRLLRDPDSVITENDCVNVIIDDINRFLTSKSLYIRHGINYKRGYVLYGPPGTGKSSIVVAVASACKLPIYLLNLVEGHADNNILSLLSSIKGPAICAIEDIDSVFNLREKHPDNKSDVTFKGLINAIDGIASASGVIYFITTNKFEMLDDALTRPGRADKIFHINYINKVTCMKMFKQYISDATTEEQEYFESVVHETDNVPAEIHNTIITILQQRDR
jgi:chaperone BCS1